MKVSIACRLLLLFCWMSWTCKSTAQVMDDFSDGDFSNGVVWFGDTGDFMVSTDRLRLNGTGSDSAFMMTHLPAVSDTMEWMFRLRMDFSPSSMNYSRYYLLSSQASLTVPLDGYFIQIGEAGAADAVRLCRQQGWSVVELIRGSDSLFSVPSDAFIRVIRYRGGEWELYVDHDIDGLFSHEGSCNDDYPSAFQYFGWKCIYTSSNSTAFYLDDVYTGTYRRDTLPPSIQTITLISDSLIDLRWNEPVELQTALSTANYVVDGLYQPYSVMQDTLDGLLFHLKLPGLSQSKGVFHLTVSGACDSYGNCIEDSIEKVFFRICDPLPGDVIITEIMADPSGAPSLPPYEYVEIFNRSPYVLITGGWKFYDATSGCLLPDDTLFPGDFLAYTQAGNEVWFHQAGIYNIRGVSGFPALNNDGDRISFRDSTLRILDAVEYDWGMYLDPLKDDMGWSLERLDLDFPCQNRGNWKASRDPSGGTPGAHNSITDDFSDVSPPWAVDAFPIDSLQIRIFFSEPMDTVQALDINQYQIDQGIGFPASISMDSSGAFLLKLDRVMAQGNLYTLEFGSGLRDCPGNPLKPGSRLKLGIPSKPVRDSVILNEILTDPFEGGSDFIEIYNNGNSPYDLSEIVIAKADPADGVAFDYAPFSLRPRLLMPGQYAVAAIVPEQVRKFYHVGDERMLIESPLPSFNDDEAVIVLLNSSFVELERFHYRNNHHFPLLVRTEGVSLERISAVRPVSDTTNWHSAAGSRGYATPCDENSQHMDGIRHDDWLKLEPELFSPDNDGYHDILGIDVLLPREGFMATMSVHDEAGAFVRHIVENELLGTVNHWFWDGLDGSGNVVHPGIYMLLSTFFHADGEVRRLRRACVVARNSN